ncbi:Retrovirus-related Pol polyprotein from transposon RE1 [Linum grandiflorum]
MAVVQATGGGDYPLSDPYYLHGSEQPGQSLVAEKLTTSNYTDWSRAMTNALGAKNKLGFINGSIEEPEAADGKFWPWTRCNIMVLSWIQQSVEANIRRTIMGMKTAVDAWQSLKGRYGQGDVIRIAELQEELSNLKQGNQSVTEYHGTIITLRDELKNYQPILACDCTATSHFDCRAMKLVNTYEETNSVIHFLRGLNENFAGPRTQVLFGDELPPLEKVVQRMVQHERQLYGTRARAGTNETMAMSVNTLGSQNHQQAIVNYAGQQNHGGGFRPSYAGNKPKMYCTRCKMTNHSIDTCFFIHGWPPGMQPRPMPTGMRPRGNFNPRFRPQSNVITQSSETQQHDAPFTQAQISQLMSMMQMQGYDQEGDGWFC